MTTIHRHTESRTKVIMQEDGSSRSISALFFYCILKVLGASVIRHLPSNGGDNGVVDRNTRLLLLAETLGQSLSRAYQCLAGSRNLGGHEPADRQPGEE